MSKYKQSFFTAAIIVGLPGIVFAMAGAIGCGILYGQTQIYMRSDWRATAFALGIVALIATMICIAAIPTLRGYPRAAAAILGLGSVVNIATVYFGNFSGLIGGVLMIMAAMVAYRGSMVKAHD
jgi:hypothetical protein